MTDLYDSEGEIIEGALTAEEAETKLAEAKTETDTKLAETTLALEEANAKIAKLDDKDTNFSKLKDKTKEEIEALEGQKSDLEKRLEAIENGNKAKIDAEYTEIDAKAKLDLMGDDVEEQKKIQYVFDNELSGIIPLTAEQRLEKWNKAKRLVPTTEANALGRTHNISGASGNTEKGFGETEEGKTKAKALGMTYQDEVKK